MSLLIKICGLGSEEAVDAALDAGADLVGFVFFPPSPRHLGLEHARTLARRVGTRAGKVVLSVDADDTFVDAVVAAVHPDYLQLHGGESAARLTALKARHGLPVIKALPVETRSDLEATAAYAGLVDLFLFDARPPREATRPGGLGRAFDWRVLAGVDPSLSFLLSGGLDASNVGEAIRLTRPRGVDVSSGVERAPGDKDPDKIRAFVRAARAAARATEPAGTA